MSIIIELENLGDEIQSLEPKVEMVGLNPITRQEWKSEGIIGGSRKLPALHVERINIDFSNNNFYSSVYTVITLTTTKVGKIKIRLINAREDANSINFLCFLSRKLVFKYWPKLYHKIFKTS